MYSNFKAQAIEYGQRAIQEDKAGNYAKAFPLYMNALEYFKTHLKYEKNPEIKEVISENFTEYLHRAEKIRALLDKGVYHSPPAAKEIHSVLDVDGDDPEKSNVKSNDVDGLDTRKAAFFREQAIKYVRQAVREDNERNYVKAYPLYMNALEYFKTQLKFEKNPKIMEVVMQKFTEYLDRAEVIHAMIDDQDGYFRRAEKFIHVVLDMDAAEATKLESERKDKEG